MIKKIIKRISKKCIVKVCQFLPQRSKNIVAKAAYCAINAIYEKELNLNYKNRLTIAVHIIGGLGDTIIAISWIKELCKNNNIKCEVHLYGRLDILKEITLFLPFITAIFDRELYNSALGYDMKCVIGHFVEIDYINTHRINDINPYLIDIVQDINNFNSKYSKFIEKRPLLDGYFSIVCNFIGLNRWTELENTQKFTFNQYSYLSINFKFDDIDIINKYNLNDKLYITIHRGIDTCSPYNENQSVKTYPINLYNDVCKKLKDKFPNIIIIQIGAHNHTKIEKCDLCLLGKTTLGESLFLLKHSFLHIDGESGLVHAKHIMSGKSIVLFGPTPVEYFGYQNNINIVSNFCSNCMWMLDDWNTKCIKGYPRNLCMEKIDPVEIVNSVTNEINKLNKYTYLVDTICIYSSYSKNEYNKLLNDICNRCNIERLDISHHMYGKSSTYIHASKQWEYPYAVSIINSIKQENLKIADVGGGRGVLAWYLAKLGHDVSVYDINYMWDNGGDIDIENKFFEFARTEGFRADFGTVFNIPAKDNSFDIVTCISVVEHIPYKYFALKELLRVLKPCGKLILTYDIVINNINREEGSRVEIFTPKSILHELSQVGVNNCDQIYTDYDVCQSIRDIKSDNVNIGDEITVGGLVITKAVSK